MKEYFVGLDSRGVYMLEERLNEKAREGWRLVAVDSNHTQKKMLFILERDRDDSKETVLLRQLLRAYGHTPEA
jgi:hypothetical protein